MQSLDEFGQGIFSALTDGAINVINSAVAQPMPAAVPGGTPAPAPVMGVPVAGVPVWMWGAGAAALALLIAIVKRRA